jgi:uncharacterized membrane protein
MAMEHSNINKYIRVVLIVGMILSVSVMIVGLIMFAFSDGTWEVVPLSLTQIFEGILRGNPIAVIDLGILLLIATPLTRVLAALVIFAVNKEAKFVLAATLVLVVVGIAIIVGG